MSYFAAESLESLQQAVKHLAEGFRDLPMKHADRFPSRVDGVLQAVAERLWDNYPYFHPLYAGQMLKPPHPVARMAAALADWINPNNHALDGGRATSQMEKEAVAELAAMFQWPTHLGHLCSGGTMANLEALWVAGQLHCGKTILASTQAHYTHSRITNVLGLAFESIAVDQNGRLRLDALHDRVRQGDVGTVVATMGTTATGSVDPLPAILELGAQYGFRVHADAAYGGYFGLVDNLASDTRASFDAMHRADSIVIDPHKHGLQPYGCGCILFRDPSVGRFYRHDSPYTYFSSTELHLGEISLECSRAGAAAAALWATQQLLPLVPGGEFARMLASGRAAAMSLYQRLLSDPRFVTAFPPDLDIVVWAPAAATVSHASQLSRKIFDEAARRQLHLAVAELPCQFFSPAARWVHDRETITCLRSVLMKPEHLAWIDYIWEHIDQATTTVLESAVCEA